MSLTPNYGMTIPASTDTVNLLTQNYPNFTILDTALKNVSDSAITVAVETKVGTVHNLVRSDSDRAFIRFTATSDYIAGDTFTVDGNAVTVLTSGGTSIPDRGFVINSNVVGVLVGAVLTLLVGGGLSSVDASDVDYDNTVSGLTATNVQDAIDEVKSDIPTSFNASAITYDNTGSGLTATDVQDAIDEVNAKATTETVTVTADGVKNDGALLNEIFAQLDVSKLTPKSGIVRRETNGNMVCYHISCKNSVGVYFSQAYIDTTGTIEGIELKAGASKSRYISGNFSVVDATNHICASGSTYTLYY